MAETLVPPVAFECLRGAADVPGATKGGLAAATSVKSHPRFVLPTQIHDCPRGIGDSSQRPGTLSRGIGKTA